MLSPHSKTHASRRGLAPAALCCLAASLLTLAAAGARAARPGVSPRAASRSGTLYYTRHEGSVNVRKVSFNYNGQSAFTLSTPADVAQVGGADGILFAPDGDILVGGASNVLYKVDPRTGGSVSANTDGYDSYHLALDPSQTKVWTAALPGTLVEVPLNPFSNGTSHQLAGDNLDVTSIAFDAQGRAYYTASGAAGGGDYGRIDLKTFTTQRANEDPLPAAHGMVYDSFTNTLVMFGADHVTQLNPDTLAIVSDLNLADGNLQLDQGTVDGLGHAYVADNGGKLLFIDYSTTGRVAANGNFRALQFLDDGLDDVAPIFGLGAPRIPDNPVNLTATASSSTQIDLSWEDRSNNEKTFEVARKVGNGQYTTIKVLPVNSTAFTDAGLTPGVTYTYQVRATNGIGESAYTPEASATTPLPAPAPPTQLGISAVTSTSLRLAWTDASNNETGFKVERKAGDGAYAEIATTAANASTYQDQNLQPSTLYTYRVRAVNSNGGSAHSNEASATTLPASPSGLRLTLLSYTSIKLEWTDNSVDESGFRIERKTGKGAFVALNTNPGVNATSFTDFGLTAGTTYTYHVRAYNANGDSANTPDATLTIPLPPKLSIASPSRPIKFPAVKRGATKIVKLKGKNIGGGPLHVIISVSGGAFLATPTGAVTVGPRGSFTLNIGFRPTAVGAASGTLTLTTDDPAAPTLTYQLTGTGK